MARRAEYTGVKKANQAFLSLVALSILGGGYIAFGAIFAATVTVGLSDTAMEGPGRFLGGLAFCSAYVLAVIGGAELFTTNNMMVMAWASRRLATLRLLRAWGIVLVGNAAGAVATLTLLLLAGQHHELGSGVGEALLSVALRIQELGWTQAFFLGLLGNTLLCLGVWLTYSARTTTDAVVAMVPAVAAFYALGLLHAIAVLFYLPAGLLLSLTASAEFWASVPQAPLDGSIPELVTDFLRVLVPVTLGNVIGGGVLVALMYWFIYLRVRG